MLGKLDMLQYKPKRDFLLNLAEPKARNLEKRHVFTEVINELKIAIGKEADDW